MSDAQESAEKQSPPVRLLTSDELGQIKAVECPSDKPLADVKQVSCWGEPTRSSGVQCIAVSSRDGADDADTAILAAGRMGGGIEVRQACSGELMGQIASTSGREDADKSIRGLHFLWTSPGSSSYSLPALLSVTCGGDVRIHQAPAEQAPGPSQWEQVASWTCPAKVCAMAVDERDQLMAIGCEGAELGVWDLATHQRTYLAKGAKPNRIGLMERPWITAVAFVPGSQGSQVLAGTGYHKLRLYDTKQRRPVMAVDFGEGRITALAPQLDGSKCWAADSTGLIGCLDLKLGKTQQVLKGSGGSVKCLSVHRRLPLIASVGLDRFLRVHNTQTQQLCCRVFLKQHLSGVAFCPAPSPPAPSTEEQQQQQQNGSEDKKISRKRSKSKQQDGTDDSKISRKRSKSKQQGRSKKAKA